MEKNNIYAATPPGSQGEISSNLFQKGSVTIERIISHAYSSPADFWYDQAEDEWVIVLRGSAVLEFGGGATVEMKDGDYLLIPSGVRHRVVRTSEHTIWLAVHIKTDADSKLMV